MYIHIVHSYCESFDYVTALLINTPFIHLTIGSFTNRDDESALLLQSINMSILFCE